MSKHTIGLDVHSKDTVYHAQDETGNEIGRGTISTTREGFEIMLEKLKVPEQTKIGMESGNLQTHVSWILSELKMKPIVIHATEVKNKKTRKRQKCDSRDAFSVCDGLRRDIYTCIVYVPDPNTEKLKISLSQRRHFVRASTREILNIKGYLRARGLREVYGKKPLNREKHWIDLLAHPLLVGYKKIINLHYELWLKIKECIDELDKEIQNTIEPIQEVEKLLRTAPGVGRIIAATFIATIGDPHRFSDSGKVLSYTGLAPSTFSSGEITRGGKIIKQGSSSLRSCIIEAGHYSSRSLSPLNPYYTKHLVTGGRKKAAVVVASKLIRILYRIWRDMKPFDISKLNIKEEFHEKIIKKQFKMAS